MPQLAALVPIKHFYDHGPMTALPEDRNFAQMYGAYRAAAKDTTTTLKPGDTIALKQGTGPKLTLTVVAASGEVVGGAATPANPACASAVAQPDDTTDNRRSVAFVLRYGAFDFYDAGDLTGDIEAKLACPVDRVGPIDLYQVTHHGQDNSNNPVLLASLKPTVAVMNNGPRKGGAAETFRRLQALPSLKGLFAIHKNVVNGAGGERRAREHRQPQRAGAECAARIRAHVRRHGRRPGEAVQRPEHADQGRPDVRGPVGRSE